MKMRRGLCGVAYAEQRTDARVRIFEFHDDRHLVQSGDSARERLLQLHRLGRSFYDDIFCGVKQLRGLSPAFPGKLRRLLLAERAGNKGNCRDAPDRKSTRLNSSHIEESRMPSSA